MCEYTSHGHCGILCGNDVDNDKTLKYLADIALSQVQAGADMVAPSDMMDGRIAAIRRRLDENGYVEYPNVTLVKEVTDAMAATQAYAANVTALNSLKTVVGKALEIGK